MSFLSKMKHALGFSPEADDDDEEEYEPSLHAAPHTSPAESAEVQSSEHSQPEGGASPAALVDAVMARARQECAEILSRVAPAPSAPASWEEEKTLLENRIAELQDGAEVNTLKLENRKLKTSLERQKRALLDRINALEAQAIQHSKEKERLYASASRKGGEAAAEARIQQLTDELETARKEAEDLKETAQREKTLREQLEVKASMSDEIINDLRNKNATIRNQVESRDKQEAEKAEEWSKLTSELETARADAAEARAEVERFQEASRQTEAEQHEIMSQVEAKLIEMEDFKARKDAKINELKEANASLKSTIEANLVNHANAEMEANRVIDNLRKEITAQQAQIEALKATLEAAPSLADETGTDNTPTVSKPRRGRPRKVKVDDIDNTDWFSATAVAEGDFGYREPSHKTPHVDDAQLSLF